jgi:hypothetical protein
MFYKDENVENSKKGKKYGDYFGTYVSERELVKVHLFVKKGYVVPFAIFKPPHHAFENVDNWQLDIEDIAKEHGYPLSRVVYWWA